MKVRVWPPVYFGPDFRGRSVVTVVSLVGLAVGFIAVTTSSMTTAVSLIGMGASSVGTLICIAMAAKDKKEYVEQRPITKR